MTSTRILLLAAACFVSLTGCDAVGPEAVSADSKTKRQNATLVLSSPQAEPGYIAGPEAMRPNTQCLIKVIADAPVETWSSSPALFVTPVGPNAATVRNHGVDGSRGQIEVVTTSGENMTFGIEISDAAGDC